MDKKLIKFRKEMADLGFYNIQKVTDDKVSFRVVNFDVRYEERVDFIILVSKDGNIEILDRIEVEEVLFYCRVKLQNLSKAFELIKEFYFEK